MERFYELDELLEAVLRRRADRPLPPSLSARVSDTIRRERQVRHGWRRPSTRVSLRLALLAIPIAFVAGAALFAWVSDGGFRSAAGFLDGSPTPGPALPTESAPSATTPAPATVTPGPSLPTRLGPGALAIVTKQGSNLSVHAEPKVDTVKLDPHLMAGTRLFVVDGPVRADEYDWYEVQPEYDTGRPFGWVSAAAHDGTPWIQLRPFDCPATLDAGTLRALSALELLACYGAHEVSFVADTREVQGGMDAPACALAPRQPDCIEEPAWLMSGTAAVVVDLDPGDHAVDTLPVYFSPESIAARDGLNLALPNLFTGSMGAPEASDCRITDAEGRPLIPRDQAVLRCLSRFVVRDVRPVAAALANPTDQP